MVDQPNTTLTTHQSNPLVCNRFLANELQTLLHDLKQSGRSRYSLCLEAGITRQTLSRLCKGDVTVTLATIEKVFRCLGKKVMIVAVDI